MIAVGLMLIGYLLRKAAEYLLKASFLIFVALTSLVIFILCVQFSTSEVGYVLMANAMYGNPLCFLVNALSGSVFVIAVSWLVEKMSVFTKPLMYIGQRTLGIFVLHKPIVEIGQKVFTKIGMDYNHPIAVIGITLGTLAASLLVVFILEMILPESIGLRDERRHSS